MIFGEKVFLRKLNQKDKRQIKKWGKDTEVARFTEIYETPKRKLKTIVFGIYNKLSQELIGDITVSSIDSKNHCAEIGITIGNKNYWGKGFCTDSVKAVIEYCFNKLKLNKIYLDVWENNKRAIGCYLKRGFRKDGLLREHVFKDKKYHNKIIMSLLKKEWKQYKF